MARAMSSDRAQDTLKSLDHLRRAWRLGDGWSCSPKAEQKGSDWHGAEGYGHGVFLGGSLQHDVGIAVTPATSHRLQRLAAEVSDRRRTKLGKPTEEKVCLDPRATCGSIRMRVSVLPHMGCPARPEPLPSDWHECITMLQHRSAWDQLPETLAPKGIGSRVPKGEAASLITMRVPAGFAGDRHSPAHEQFAQVLPGSASLLTDREKVLPARAACSTLPRTPGIKRGSTLRRRWPKPNPMHGGGLGLPGGTPLDREFVGVALFAQAWR